MRHQEEQRSCSVDPWFEVRIGTERNNDHTNTKTTTPTTKTMTVHRPLSLHVPQPADFAGMAELQAGAFTEATEQQHFQTYQRCTYLRNEQPNDQQWRLDLHTSHMFP